jgi:dihydroxyacetone kinase-like predicted kinase
MEYPRGMLIDRISMVTALAGFHADLTRFQAQLNQINTLPVPDHDTGTNLLATVAQILAAASPDPVRAESPGMYETFGNSGMLIGAWLEGAEAVIGVPAPIGQMAVTAASEVKRTIVSPRPGLFLDYALRSASLLSRVDPGFLHEGAAVIADDLRMLLVETAAAAPDLHQLVDSGSAGLYFLLKRLLSAGPDSADEVLFEPLAHELSATLSANGELVEFLFAVENSSRNQILAMLSQFSVESVMLGRGLRGGIKVHCHGPGRMTVRMQEALAACSTVTDFRVRQIYREDQP